MWLSDLECSVNLMLNISPPTRFSEQVQNYRKWGSRGMGEPIGTLGLVDTALMGTAGLWVFEGSPWLTVCYLCIGTSLLFLLYGDRISYIGRKDGEEGEYFKD